MDPRRARTGDWLMGGFAAVLIVSLFLGWYCAPPSGADGEAACGRGETFSAWQAFAVVDIVLLVAGLVGLVALVMTLAHATPAVPVALTAMGALAAIVAAVLVVVRLLAPPGLPGAPDAGAVTLLGAWLGTGAALGLALVMIASIRDERTPTLAERGAGKPVRTLTVSSPGERGDSASASQPEGAA
jgi:hypothetical protein